jgi:hypothetical protein
MSIHPRFIISLPHVIVLHICYWLLLTHIHRPFYQSDHASTSDQQRVSHHFQQIDQAVIVDLSVTICTRAGHHLLALITLFDDQHGMQFFPRNMIQVRTLSYHSIHSCFVSLMIYVGHISMRVDSPWRKYIRTRQTYGRS